ncbi:MAG: hypothetical protein EP332_13015 [Bacteroidetes bacterium]|nr:MAG: hypothetical protein EP332_13015 [Bacteroidota bacterium]
MKKLSLLLPFILLLSACFKDQQDPLATAGKKRLWIINEGNFQWGNASLSLYDLASEKLVHVKQFEQNNGFPIGDVFQSMIRYNNQFYLVVNNSGKIHVCDADMKYQRSIDQLGSPRYLMPYGTGKALLSDLYSNTLKILDLQNGTVAQTLSFPGWGEKLFSDGDKIWACNLKSRKLFRFDTQTEQLSDSLDIGYAATTLVKDAQNRNWVLAKGDTAQQIKPRLSRLSADGKQVEQYYELDLSQASDMVYDPSGNRFIILAEDLYTFSETQGLSAQALVPSNNRNLYAIALVEEELFVADAVDYVQKGQVYRYNLNGTLLGNFGVGPIPNGFLFDN